MPDARAWHLALDPDTLAAAAGILEGADAGPAGGTARETLAALGWPADETGADANRACLLRLGSGLARVFALPAPDSPGAVFVGAEVDPAAFGLPRPDSARVGVSGFGLVTGDAFARCMGEAAEYLSLIRRGDERTVRGPLADLAGRVPQPDWIYAGLGLDARRDRGLPLDWLTLDRPADGSTALVPADLCLRRARPADDPVRRPAESAGHAAGRTLDEAVRHGLLELVERDAVAMWWFGGRPARPLPVTSNAAALLDALRGVRPARPTWLLGLDSEIGVPVVAALSCNADGSGVVLGASARPARAEAVVAALLEMAQMEVAQRLVFLKLAQRGVGSLNPTDRRVLERASTVRRDSWPELHGVEGLPDGAADLWGEEATTAALIRRSEAAGFPAFVRAAAIPAERGIAAAQVLVPGLQSAAADWLSDRLAGQIARAGLDATRIKQRISLI